jgi:hypothetical protein
LPSGKHTGILTEFLTKDKKKIKKSAFFEAQVSTDLPSEIQDSSFL